MAVPNIFGSATSAIPLSQLDQNFATAITLGNTAVYLGNTTTSLGNVTLTNVTISSGNVTVSTATVGAGSNTAPSITTTGDTNTGIFFPAADTIAFSEGGVESMRIDSSGNVGIGTSSPAVSGLEISRATGSASPTPAELRISTTNIASDWSTTNPWGRLSFYSADASSTGPKIVSSIDATAEGTSGGTGNISFKLAAATTGTLTEAMLITSAGNVGIGTSAPNKTSISRALTVNGSSNAGLELAASDVCYGLVFANSSRFTLDTNNSGANIINFYTSGAERARIDSSGNLLVGKTATTITGVGIGLIANGKGNFTVDSDEVLNVNRLTNDGNLIRFYQASTEEGNISVSGTTVSYNGGHLSRWAQTITAKDESLVKGTVLSNLDAMNVYTDAEGNPVQNEQLNKVKVSDIEGDANVAGVFVNWTHDDAHNVDEINMAMTGDMIIRIAQGVTVARGDLLMSAGDGTAKPQGDDIVRSKTIAKVTSTHVTCTYADGSFCVPCVLMAC